MNVEASAIATEDGEVGGSVDENSVGDGVGEDVGLHLVWCGVVLMGLMGLMIGGCGVCGKGVECYLSVHGGLIVLASIQRNVCNNRLRMFARYKEKILEPGSAAIESGLGRSSS